DDFLLVEASARAALITHAGTDHRLILDGDHVDARRVRQQALADLGSYLGIRHVPETGPPFGDEEPEFRLLVAHVRGEEHSRPARHGLPGRAHSDLTETEPM